MPGTGWTSPNPLVGAVIVKDGRIIEEGDRDTIFDSPKEAYTRRLLSAIPALDQNEKGGVTLKWRLEDEV